MSRLSRRSFLAASAALVAAPALAAKSSGAEVDVVIVGAGAAGIAAARRVAAANRSFRLFEAGDRIGGRCVTDTKIFGAPYDLGAHWIHNPDSNPLAAAAAKSGLDVYPAPRAQTLRVGARSARDSELEIFLATQLRSHRAMADASKAKADMPAVRALPKDLFDWQATVEFILGPFAVGKDLKDVSALDLARARSSARATPTAGRAMARCSPSSAPGCRCSLACRSTRSTGAIIWRSTRRKEICWRAPRL
jgi:phytoene dehydrogenase-like protein